MKKEHDHSTYTTVCTINICFIRHRLTIYRTSNRTAKASTRYVPFKYLDIPLGFYYNKEDGDIIYGSLMELHYKHYPPQKRYIHISNFLQDLHVLYQKGCDKELQLQRKSTLYLATKAFLTRIYPSQLRKEKDTSAIQYVFILPTQDYASENFVEAFWLPLLQDTPWAAKSTLSNKIKFHYKFQCLIYYLNKQIELQREHLYLLWNLQRSSDGEKLLVDIASIRAVYDPDLISASGRSTATLGGNILYSPKAPFPTTSFEVLVPLVVEKMNELATFLYEKVFATQQTVSDHTLLDEYYADSQNKSIIHQLISGISQSFHKDEWDTAIEVDQFMNSYQMSRLFSEESKSRLSLITYGDVLQLFDDSNIFSYIKDKVVSAIQTHSSEENFHNLVVMEEDGWTLPRQGGKKNLYDSPAYNFATEHYHRFYSIRAQHTIFNLVKESSRSKSSTTLSFKKQNLTDGCAYKSLNMVELFSKTKRPIVVESTSDYNKCSSGALLNCSEKVALINLIQPYGYYVEANINLCNEIKLSLNQVIETADSAIGMRKSTLSILDVCCKTTDMYEFVSDYIWETVSESMAEQASNATKQEEVATIGSYKVFISNLTDAMKKCMENVLVNITDLDDIIYNHQPNSVCNFSISHRFLMDVGLMPYLKYKALVIVSSLKADAIFGKHQISCLVATGDQLYAWVKQYNPTYGNFLWDRLKLAIATALQSKEARTHLVMRESIVSEDSICNYKPLKLELYRQVFNKHYYVDISFAKRLNAKVHQDKGSHRINIPCTTEEEDSSIWRISISNTTDEGTLRSALKEKFYINFDLQLISQAHWSFRLICVSKEELNNSDEAISSNFNVALHVGHDPFDGSTTFVKNRISFPLEVDIRPCSHSSAAVDLKMRMGINVSSLRDPLKFERNEFPERLTLQAI